VRGFARNVFRPELAAGLVDGLREAGLPEGDAARR
jgi:hypothetical protein